MAEYRVNLDIFAGPLDLLLYLVRKEEVDIYDIPIARITDQYLRYIDMLKSLDIDLAGDFLVMAATLMQIKSAMLLPKTDSEGLEADDLNDPRIELVRQLLEYKRFKDAANLLGESAEQAGSRFARPATIIEQLKGDDEPTVDLEQVSIWDLLAAFDNILAATGRPVDISRISDETPIDLYQIEILHRLQTDGPLRFEQIFEPGTKRLILVGLFLALLELIREKLVWAEQAAASGTIHLKTLTDEPAEQAVQRAIITAASDTKADTGAGEREIPRIPIEEVPTADKTTTTKEYAGNTHSQQNPGKVRE